jgi:hypothetical protein
LILATGSGGCKRIFDPLCNPPIDSGVYRGERKGEHMEVAIVIVAFIAFVGFRQWLQHQRRMLIHRERLAAIEKGVELPPLEQEVRRSNWNVQRVLLLAGLIWISLGVGAFVTLVALLGHSPQLGIPEGIEFVALAPVAIGLSHLIVYGVGRTKER